VLADVTVQLGHERLAEPHHLGVGPALGLEVRPTLAAADRHAGQRILEDLFKAKEFHDPEVDRRMKTQATLERAERGVELDPETAVDLHGAAVVDPGHPEDDLAFGFAQPPNHLGVDVLGVLLNHRPEAGQYLVDGLVELALARVATRDLFVDVMQLFV
jgi:hypothetical protein